MYIQGDKQFMSQKERSEMLSNKRICEGDSDVSSDEEVNDKITTTQRHEDSGEHNSIDGTIEESQA